MRTGLVDSNEPDVAAAMQGDRHALDRLWQEHRRWIAAVLLAHKPRAEDLDDLLQEVAMTLVSKINTLREHSNLRAWLRSIAVNAARAAGRNDRSRTLARLSDGHAEMLPQPGRFEFDDQARDVLERVSQLPEAYREPLLLKAVHGMRTRQIAEILDLPEATVDTRISRARRMLRDASNAAHQLPPVTSRRATSLNGTTTGRQS